MEMLVELVVGGLASSLVQEGICAPLVVTRQEPADLTVRDAERARRFDLCDRTSGHELDELSSLFVLLLPLKLSHLG